MTNQMNVWILTTILLATAPYAVAQQMGKVYRVGFLSGGFPPTTGIEAMRRALREIGYVEGQNIVYEYRYAEDKPERSPGLAADLVHHNVDVIVASGGSDTSAAKSTTKTTPIVFLESIADPAELGLVDSLAKPGGNITGFTTMATELAGKRLELLKEALPKATRVAVLWDPSTRETDPQWKQSEIAARQLGLQLYSMAVSSADKYESAFKDAVKAGTHALAVTRHRRSLNYHKRLIELAAKYRLPAIYFREDIVAQGGLMSYGADGVEPFKRASVMVDKILKGTKPADIPVERSSKFEFVVNLKTAKALGLTIPPNVLVRADRVIR